MKKFVLAVLTGLSEGEIDSVKTIGSVEVGDTCEESNVLEFEELQNVFANISGVRLVPELLQVSR